MNLTKSKIFLIGCLSFIVGIGVASWLPGQILEKNLWWFSGWIILTVLTILFWQQKTIRLSALIGLFLFLGFWRYSLSLPETGADKIWFYNGRQLELIGRIVNQPDIRENHQKLEISSEKLNFGQGRGDARIAPTNYRKVTGKILVTTNLYPTFNYGDRLKLFCRLQAPEPFQSFAYDRYLARFEIYSVCYYPLVSLLATGQGNWFYQKIFSLKNKLIEIIDQGLPEPAASLASPLILGGQKGLPEKYRQQFSALGLSHILAVSGFNITIVSGLVMMILLAVGLNRHQAFYLACFFLVIYLLLVGLTASAARAGLMGFLVLLALELGRLNKITNTLVLSAAILLLLNPKLLGDDLGFQLSFLALAGLVYFYPVLEAFFDKIKLPKFKGLRSILSLTLAAQIFTMPVTAYNFSHVSLIAPLANLLIIWSIPFLTMAIMVALALSWLLPIPSWLFFLPANLFLKYILIMTDWLVKIPFGYLAVNYFWSGWLVLYYGLLAWLLYRYKNFFS